MLGTLVALVSEREDENDKRQAVLMVERAALELVALLMVLNRWLRLNRAIYPTEPALELAELGVERLAAGAAEEWGAGVFGRPELVDIGGIGADPVSAVLNWRAWLDVELGTSERCDVCTPRLCLKKALEERTVEADALVSFTRMLYCGEHAALYDAGELGDDAKREAACGLPVVDIAPAAEEPTARLPDVWLAGLPPMPERMAREASYDPITATGRAFCSGVEMERLRAEQARRREAAEQLEAAPSGPAPAACGCVCRCCRAGDHAGCRDGCCPMRGQEGGTR